MSASIKNIGIAGAGAWGTALATVAIRAGCRVTLWAHDREVAADINTAHENRKYLPGINLNEAIKATDTLSDVADCDAVLLVTPAQNLRTIATNLAPYVTQELPVVICSKGLEKNTNMVLSGILAHTMPQAVACILSGPSFAADVARGLPTAVTLASTNIETAEVLARALGSSSFRPYASDDLVGAQIGGAVKNVLAIACGIVEGRSLGQSARAALTCRGFAELVRFGLAHGAKIETLSGLSGLGDLILTCSSRMSRNMSLGYDLGRGYTLEQILKTRQTVTEGIHTASVVCEIAQQKGIEMPICEAVRDIAEGSITVDQAIENLMARPFRQE